ncbi:hypothetical protein [Halarchaeum salinum]|uniref:Uncharacterized protein n=1 Tax=Halarchaeum salinum TaxID=489912 RepID=A0AAV3S380_9EURY
MPNEENDSARYRGSRTSDSIAPEKRWAGRHTEPGRVPGEDSLIASREDNPRSDEGYDYTGFETPAATRIGDETDDNPEIERLREHHDGRHRSDSEHSARETERDKERFAQGICSSLPLSKQERQHVVTAVKSFDLDRFGNQKSITKVALGTAAVLVDEYYREGAEELDDLVRRSEEFREIREKHGISMSDLNTVKGTVRDLLDSEPVPVKSEVRNRDPALPEPTAPDDLPRQYWEERSSESWVSVARGWERKSEKYKDAIPAEYKERIRLLRKWEPWTDDPESEAQDTTSSPSEPIGSDDKDPATVVEEIVEGREADDESENK